MTDAVLPSEHVGQLLDTIALAVAAGNEATSLDLVETASRLDPDHLDAGLLHAGLLEDLGRIDDARIELERLAARHGDVAEVWRRLGLLSLRCGDSERAVEALRQRQRLAGTTPENELQLAFAYLADLDQERATSHARAAADGGADGAAHVVEVLSTVVDHASAESTAGWLLCANDALEPGLALLESSLRRRPGAETQHRLGAALMLDRRHDEALTHLRAASEARPDDTDVLLDLGDCQLVTGDPDAAAATFEQVLELHPGDVAATIGLARVAIDQGAPDRAARIADGLIDQGVDTPDVWIVRAQALQTSGHAMEALVSAEMAIAADPTARRAWIVAAGAAAESGEHALAQRYGGHAAIRLSGSLGIVEGNLGSELPDDLTTELHHLDRIVVADPRVRPIYLRRAGIADVLFDAHRAVAYLDAAIDRGTVDATGEVHCERGALLLRAGDLDAAAAAFESVPAGDPAAERAAAGRAEIERRRSETSAPEPTGTARHGTPEPVAEMPRAWTATHRVPSSGLPAYVEPVVADEPAARLDPALGVELIETLGTWAHVRCENGWTCWADARLLAPERAHWHPTHTIGARGGQGRTTPSSSSPEAASLVAGLPVEVLSRHRGWAMIRFENDWNCWVEAEALEAIP